MRWLLGILATVLVSLIGWWANQNDRVHTVLFRQGSEADARLDKLERDAAAMRERVRAIDSRKR
jgi:hypothetical protein